jgi:hypothetical protein
MAALMIGWDNIGMGRKIIGNKQQYTGSWKR